MIPDGVWLISRNDSQGVSDENRSHNAHARQSQGGLDSLADHHSHILRRPVRSSQIAMEQIGQPEEIPDDDWLIQSKLNPHRLQICLGHFTGGGQNSQRSAGSQVNQQINCECDSQKYRNRID